MVKKTILLLIFSIALLNLVSAEVWFNTQLKSVYNFGDNIEISVSVSQTREQLTIELFCENQSKTIFLKYLTDETAIEFSRPLTYSFLEGLKGNCKLTVNYDTSTESSNFKISDEIIVKAEIETRDYAPLEEIKIKGNAEKENTQLLNGFFETIFENLTVSGEVKNGKFETNFTFPEDIAAGSYLIKIKTYDKENEEIANIGETGLNINIKQVPKNIDIALNTQSIKPGNDLKFKILLHDQSGNTIQEEASFLINDDKGNSFVKGLTKINEDRSFYVEKALPFGYYKIKVYSSGLYGERQFYVEENEEAGFKVMNGTLLMKNIGNVKYNKAVQVKIGSVIEIINTELEIGEEKEFILAAPDGNYDIEVTDGLSSISSKETALTGSAVSIKETGMNFFSRNKIMAWLFLIFVMGMFIFVSARRVLKKRFVLSNTPFKPETEKGRGVIKVGKSNQEIIVKKEPTEAEHTLVLKGHKQDTAVICLKIKNELSREAKENLNKILKGIGEGQTIKPVNYKSGDYIMSIFSPLITKTFKNYVPAAKAAIELEKKLEDYNQKFKDKIDFGVSVHTGNMVNRIEENKLKFTGLGNTLSLAKKIAELSNQEVLLSKEMHSKTLADIKTDRIEKEGLELFIVKRVTTEKNEKFIQDFLRRQEEEKSK